MSDMKNPQASQEHYERRPRGIDDIDTPVTKATRGIFSKVTEWLVIAVVSGSIAFAGSQYAKGSENAANIMQIRSDIKQIERVLEMEITARKDSDAMQSRSIDRITASLDVQNQLSAQLVALIKAQNQLLNKP